MDRTTNLLEWYPFEENAKVLEIYNEVSILQKYKRKIDLKQISIKDFNIDGQYDYIALIGTYEYAPTIIEDEKPYSIFLRMLKKHLNPNGKILLAIDNRLGIKYFVGAKSEYYETIFEGLENEIRNKKPNLLLKKELEKFIKEADFKNYKFYYPLSDYKNVCSIFTDEFMPKSNNSKIIYPVNYENGSIIIYNEINVMKQICDNNKFADFTNSYLVEISDGEINNDIKFVNYNIFRKQKYQLVLIIDKNTVKKYALTSKGEEHVKNISKYIKQLKKLGFNVIEEVRDGIIISNFIEKEELDKKIVEKIKQEDIENAYNEIQKWYNYIKQRLEKDEVVGLDAFEKYEIEVPNEIKEKMQFIKNGYIDLSFENVFCSDEYIFYDQEWYIENLPLEFILYRSINNLYTYNSSKIEYKVPKIDMMTKFNLVEFIPYFEELEEKIQKEILDEDVLNEYRNKINKYYKNLEMLNENNNKMQEIEKQMTDLKEEYEVLKEEYEVLKEESTKNENSYNQLLNECNSSRAWKIIKGIKSFFGKE